MQRKWQAILAGLALAFWAATAAAGGARNGGETYVDLFAGNTFFDSAAGLGLGSADNGGVYGLRLGQRLNGHVGVEAQIAAAFAHLQGEVKGGNAGQYAGSVQGVFYLLNRSNTPFLTLGLGASSNRFGNRLDRSTELMGVFGVGYQHQLTRHIGLRVDAQDQMLFNAPVLGGQNLNDVQVTGGLSFTWGGGSDGFPVIGPHPR